jgi:anti-anti-sigma factor
LLSRWKPPESTCGSNASDPAGQSAIQQFSIAPAALSHFNRSIIMAITKNHSGDSLELIVSERVDGAAANALEIEIVGALRQGTNQIYVNLSEATFLCSAALRVLLQYYRQMKLNGKKFLVTRPSPEAASALEMTGFTDLIEK